MATIKDVAKLAGVSHGTVSNVLKGVSTVSLENVRKVEKAIEELGYRPNASAMFLKSDSTRFIGIILPNITDSLYSRIYTTVSRSLTSRGYVPLLYITNEIPHEEQVALDAVTSIKPAGIIIATCQPDNVSAFQPLLSENTPIVFIERDIPGISCNFVGFRNDKTLHYVVGRLLAEGYRHIGLVAGSERYSSEQLCAAGYRKAYSDAGISPEPEMICFTDGSNADAFKATARLFASETIPDAIISSNSQLISGILGALKYMTASELPRLLTLCEDSWNDCRFPGVLRLPRTAEQMSDTILHILQDNIQNPKFYDCRKTLLSNVYLTDGSESSPSVHVREKTLIRAVLIEGEMADSLNSLLPDFKRKTGIDVEIRTYAHEELFSSICSEAEKSDTDVFLVDVLWMTEMARRGFLADLTPKIDPPFLTELDIDPVFLDNLASYKGQVYAIPYQYCCQLLFFRRDLFENLKYRRMFYEQYKTKLRPPESWAEFNAVARFFTRKYNPESPVEYGTTLGGRFSSASFVEYLTRFWAYGAEVFDKKGNVTLYSQNSIRALNNYQESYQYASPESPNHWWYEQVQEFASGKTAMMIMFASYVTSLTDRSSSDIVGKIGFSSVPGRNSVLGGWSLGINQKSKKQEAALEFIRWSCSKHLAFPLMLLGSQTAGRSIYKSEELLTIFPWLKTTLDCFPTCRRRQIPENSGSLTIRDYEQIVARAVNDCILGDDEPDHALKNAADRIEAMMEKKLIPS